MATFILTWDAGESGYPAQEYAEHVARTAGGEVVPTRWSVGARRSGVSVGDRVFLLRQHRDRGIVASGRVTVGQVFADSRWDDPTGQAWYVSLAWETVLPVEQRLPLEELQVAVPGQRWDRIYASGQKLTPPSDAQLELLWASHTAGRASGDSWTTPVGATLDRRERAERYGGALYGRIEPSVATPNVFIYSDPRAGRTSGYNYDGWNADGSVFMYTGEGRHGSQQLRDGNAAILRHQDDGRALRLFVDDGAGPGSAARVPRYLGRFRVDPDHPFLTAEAPDVEGNARTVVVFRLLPVGEVLRRDEERSGSGDAPLEGVAEPVPVRAATTPPGSADPVPVEALGTHSYAVSGSAAATAVKREAELIERYQAHLEGLGHSCVRYRIRPRGELRDLYTDLIDENENVLYEAKGIATREAIRMAIGQLLDYRRHIPADPDLAILLPARPTDDLLDLLRGQDIKCVHETTPGQYTES